MSIPGSANPLLLASKQQYLIQRSLRFNASDSAYASRTFTTPTTQGTFTFSTWVKRAALGSAQQLFGVSTNHSFGFTSGDALNLTFGGVSALTTTAVFRDPGAWYHIVWTQSGTSHTIYVNNVSVGTATATSSVFNTAVAHQIGAANTANYFSGYLAEIHFIDGQALTPSSFTEVSATTGQLIPKAYTGTFTGNSFWLKFEDNSAATATTLGKDSSGLGNNWTPSTTISVLTGAYTKTGDISSSSATITNTTNSGVTAGDLVVSSNFPTGTKVNSTTSTTIVCSANANTTATGETISFVNPTTAAGNDSLVDTPTSYGTDDSLGGSVRGNYATLSPLVSGSNVTLSNGNLRGVSGGAGGGTGRSAFSTIAVDVAQKWYCEALVGSTNVLVGIIKADNYSVNGYPGETAAGYGYYENGQKYNSGSGTAYGATFTTGDLIGIAIDNGTLTFYKNGSSQGAAFTGLSGQFLIGFGSYSNTVDFNFGQRPWAYTPPANHRPIVDTLLPAPVVAKTTTGTFTGNAAADGPFVFLNYVPTAMTINGNAVTFGTHADKLAGGFKVRTNSTSYNTSGSNSYSITTTGADFKYARAQTNP